MMDRWSDGNRGLTKAQCTSQTTIGAKYKTSINRNTNANTLNHQFTLLWCFLIPIIYWSILSLSRTVQIRTLLGHQCSCDVRWTHGKRSLASLSVRVVVHFSSISGIGCNLLADPVIGTAVDDQHYTRAKVNYICWGSEHKSRTRLCFMDRIAYVSSIESPSNILLLVQLWTVVVKGIRYNSSREDVCLRETVVQFNIWVCQPEFIKQPQTQSMQGED